MSFETRKPSLFSESSQSLTPIRPRTMSLLTWRRQVTKLFQSLSTTHVTEILGKRVFRKLTDIKSPIDMVNVFRRPNDIPPHVDDIIAAKPKSVWFQLGIRNDASAEQLAREGIDVILDRCRLEELRRIGR